MYLSIICVCFTYSICLRHLNVAKFVGVTQGYCGPNGIVVAMGKSDPLISVVLILQSTMTLLDGMGIDQFLSRTHSGAVWAECVSCLAIPLNMTSAHSRYRSGGLR